MEGATLVFKHGGALKETKTGLQYIGGMGRTFQIDPDEMCWWDLKELAKKCGTYKEGDQLYYLVPGESMEVGLREVVLENADHQVLEMARLAVKSRAIHVFVKHGLGPNKSVSSPSPKKSVSDQKKSASNRKKNFRSPTKSGPSSTRNINTSPITRSMTSPEKLGSLINTATTEQPAPSAPSFTRTIDSPLTNSTTEYSSQKSQKTPQTHKTSQKTSQNTQHQDTDKNLSFTSDSNLPPDFYDFYDDRPEDPIPLNELVGNFSDSSNSDELYEPEEPLDEYELQDESVEHELEDEPLEHEFEAQLDFEVDTAAIGSGGESSDDEFQRARENLRGFNNKLFEIAVQLQKDAGEGRLGSQRKDKGASKVNDTPNEERDPLSEYEDSENECNTPDYSDEEGDGVRRKSERKVVHSSTTDFTKFQWEVGQRFPSRQDFRSAVTKFAVAQGRDLYFSVSSKNRNQRLGVKCKSGCPFKMYASWDKSSACFVLKSIVNEHTCHRTMEKNRQLKSTWLADQFLELFKARPHWPASEIIETTRRAYRVIIKRDKAYKVKYWAHKKLHGSMKEHYQKLGRYLAALRKASPTSVFILQNNLQVKTLPPVFQRLFICFDGLKQGWLNGCRRVLCVDGCFLKTFLGGQLLAAIGRDGNDQMFPLAWAVVEGECNDSWEWFFTNLSSTMGAGDGTGWTIISDENQGILNGVAKVFPSAEHRHCARHIFAHWHKMHRGEEMKKLFWAAAWAYSETDLQDCLEQMEKVSPIAVDDFKSYDPKVFCRAFMKVNTKCDVVTSNMAETFNGYIIQARTKHIIYMLEDIRGSLMQRLVTKRLEMEKNKAVICPRIQAKLEKEKELAAQCHVMPSTEFLFGVSDKLDKLVVNLQERTCSCRKWDLTGVPCSHAIACIFFMHMEAEAYVHDCYKRDVYLVAYSSSIPPIEGDRHWPRIDCDLLPPPIKIGPGRPRKNRRKDPFEDPKKKGKLTRHGQVLTCSVCKSKDHTKRKCPDKGKEVEIVAKRPRGRPRKDGTNLSEASQLHSEVTAEPSRTGRGGRVIRGGRGSRGAAACGGSGAGRGRGAAGGGSGAGRGRGVGGGSGASRGRGATGGGSGAGRGRGGRILVGVGVFTTADGTPMSNMPGQRGGPRVLIGESWFSSQQSQASCSNSNNASIF